METPNFNQLLKYLRDINLPADQFAIFGSGPLAARGLRDCRDLDIVVTEELWKELLKNYFPDTENQEKIILHRSRTTGETEIEAFRNWRPIFSDVNSLIDSADIIDGVRFVNLENVKKWKTEMGREKDKADLELIKAID